MKKILILLFVMSAVAASAQRVRLNQLERAPGPGYTINTDTNGIQFYDMPRGVDTFYLQAPDTLVLITPTDTFKVGLPMAQIDTFEIVGNELHISLENDGVIYHSVDLTPYLDNTDNQTLSYDYAGIYDTISISNGNSIYLVDSFNLVDNFYIENDSLKILDDSINIGVPLDSIRLKKWTPWSIFFAGPDGYQTENNPTMRWDNIDHKLTMGVGYIEPANSTLISGASLGYESYILGTRTLGAIIGGGDNLINENVASIIVGGAHHEITYGAGHNSINGGSTNIIDSSGYSAILSGQSNLINNSTYSGILGGRQNYLNGVYSSFTMGYQDTVLSDYSWASGYLNKVNAVYSYAHGYNNRIETATGYIFGAYNLTSGAYATVFGANNDVAGVYSMAVGSYNSVGGTYNYAFGTGFTIASTVNKSALLAGSSNTLGANVDNSVIAGGSLVTINADYAGAVSAYNSTINARFTGLLGGRDNVSSSEYTGLIGGRGNTIASGASYSAMVGGLDNDNYGDYSGLVGGRLNTINATADYSALVGGYLNTLNSGSTYSVILGGNNNTVNSSVLRSAVIGGASITADKSDYVFIPNEHLKGSLYDSDNQRPNDYILSQDAGGVIWIDPTLVETAPQTIDTFDIIGQLIRLSLDRDGEPYHSITIPIDTVADHDWHTATGGTPWSINDNIHTKGKIAINDGYKSIWIGVDSAGYQTGSTGANNLMLLDSAGWNNLTGSGNFFIGPKAGYENTSGYNNYFIGNNSGHDNTTGRSNLYIGAGTGDTITGALYNVLIGDSVATNAYTLLQGNTIVGYGAAARATSLFDNVIVGLDAAFFSTDMTLNTVIGPFTGDKASGTTNVLVGHYAGEYTSGESNVFIGTYAGSAHAGGSQTGSSNVAIGDGAGEELSTGSNNVYVGLSAGGGASTGSNNVLLGAHSGEYITGSHNLACGTYAAGTAVTGNYNMFLGYQSGNANDGGNKNIFAGYEAGLANTTGSNNIFLGESAGSYNTTGGNNIFLGSFAGSYSGLTNENWVLRIGQGDDTTATIYGGLDPFSTRQLSFNTDTVRFWHYPNDRADAITPANFFGSDGSGNLLSFSLDTVIATVQRNITTGSMDHFYWDSGNDGGAGVEITDGETITITGTNGITTSPSGNTIYIDGSGTYWGWELDVDYSFSDLITDTEVLNFVGGTGISLSYDGANLTITNTSSSSYTDWDLYVNGSHADYITDGEILGFSAGSGITLSYVSGATIQITNSGDASSTNELQTLTSSGTTSFTSTLSDGGGSFTLSAGSGIGISRSGNTATISSTASFAWNLYVNGSYQEGIQSGEALGFTAGSGISISYSDPTITISATGSSSSPVWDYSGGDATSTTQNIFRSGAVSIGAINDDFVDGGTSEPILHVYSSSGSRTINTEFYNAATTMRLNLRNSSYTNYIDNQAGNFNIYSNSDFNVTALDDIFMYAGTNDDLYMIASGTGYAVLQSGSSGAVNLIAGSSGLAVTSTKSGFYRTATSNALEVEGNASKTSAGSWLANSDRRIKQDIHSVAHPYETLELLNPVTFRYTDQWMEMNPAIKDHVYYNYVAQEYRNVFPDDVKGSGEYLPGDPDEILQIDDHAAQIVTTAAVKQLIADYKALAKRVEELESQLKKDGKN